MGLLNYTTKIDADKTAQEIAKELSMHGARAVLTEYDEKEGLVVAISFKINVDGADVAIKLPCDYKPVYAIMAKDKDFEHMWNKEKRAKQESELRAQSVRTAWRIVKDWVEAQMALIETKMVKTEQVFLPYVVTKSGQTVFEKMVENKFLLNDGQ
jgi:hypothetical protein